MNEIKGKCFGVRLEERKDYEPLIIIMCEDDENWFDELSFSSYWLDELIKILKIIKKENKL